MMNVVDYPVCINPSDGLKKYAMRKGWTIPTLTQIEDRVREYIIKE